ncbi:hypothetical protein QE152_g36565 [Popillia japonica]|uniref:Uncharacterized protein n=1 Tax=Popillia japonica TaxID=7064 RepID=A0AAW1ICQ7_POPJA
MSNSGPGFDSKEFFRRHGSISKLCRKARSVDNLSMNDADDDDQHFGLPMLAVSGPSPPEDEDETEMDKFIKQDHHYNDTPDITY